MDDMNNLKNSDALFDQSLLDELNAATSDGPSEVSEHTSDGEVADKSDSERAASDKPSDDELPVKKPDDTERAVPEEYIEEFFSDEKFTPNIEDYIEPEA